MNLTWRQLQDLIQIVEQQRLHLTDLLSKSKEVAFNRVYEDKIKKCNELLPELRNMWNDKNMTK